MRTEMSEEGWDHPPNSGTMITDSEAAEQVRPEAPVSLDDPALYINRELSWLAFNDRVLEEALDARNPLLERLKFIAIYGTNLDEFFMIRVAGLKQQIEAEVHKRSEDGLMPEEQLEAVAARLRPSLRVMTSCLDDELLPALAGHGIKIVDYEQLETPTRLAMEQYFHERVFPVLTPLAIDAGHPFPYISTLSLSLAVELRETAHGRRRRLRCPREGAAESAALRADRRAGRPALVRAGRRSDRAQPAVALPRHDDRRLVRVPRHARRRPRSARR